MAIEIPVSFPGLEDGADQLADLVGGLDDVSRSAMEYARRLTDGSNQTRELIGRAQTLVQGVQTLSGAFGGRSDSLVERMTAVTDAAGTLGGLFGPTGQLVGGIVSLAGRAIPQLLEALMGIPERQEAVEETTRQATEAIVDQGEAADTAAESLRNFLAEVTTSSRASALQVEGERIAQLADEIERLESSGNALDRLDAMERRAQYAEATARFEAEALDLQREQAEVASSTRRQSGGGGTDAAAEAERDFMREIAGIEAEMLGLEADRLALKQEQIEALRVEEETRRHNLEVERHAAEERQAIAEREKEAEVLRLEAQEADRDKARASADETAEHVAEGAMLLGTAIGEVVAGTESAEDAFKGMLAGFLEMIAEQAALSALREYAEAIASFARYDYGGGAQHLAAGVAFTALAVAAGAGAVALSAPSAQKPTGPEEREDMSDRGRGDVIVNLNSPVMTAQTRAELGRSLQGAINDAEAMG